jgi:hypothetical protein
MPYCSAHELSLLENEIINAEKHLASLRCQRNHMVSPLCRLPPEIGGKILLAAQIHDAIQDRSYIDMRECTSSGMGLSWLGAMGTCRRLREVVIQTGLLWSFIDFTHSNENWISCCLSRCKNSNLYVYHRLGERQQSDEDFQRFMELVIKSRRILVVAYNAGLAYPYFAHTNTSNTDGRAHDITRFLAAINQHTPNLQTVELRNQYRNLYNFAFNPIQFSRLLFEGGDPVHLRSLTLEGVYFNDPPPFPKLQRLTLINIDLYRSNYFKGFIQLLRQASSIQFLCLDNSSRSNDVQNMLDILSASCELEKTFEPISLRDLHTLRILGNPCLCRCMLKMLPDPKFRLAIEDPREEYLPVTSLEIHTQPDVKRYTAELENSLAFNMNRIAEFMATADDDNQLSVHEMSLDVKGADLGREDSLVVLVDQHPRLSSELARRSNVTLRLLSPKSWWYNVYVIANWMDLIRVGFESPLAPQSEALELFAPIIPHIDGDWLELTLPEVYFSATEYVPPVEENQAEDKSESPSKDIWDQIRNTKRDLNATLAQPNPTGEEMSEVILNLILCERFERFKVPVRRIRLKYPEGPHGVPFPDEKTRERVGDRWINAGWVAEIRWTGSKEMWVHNNEDDDGEEAKKVGKDEQSMVTE